jgi:hypothetical protein
MQTHVLLLYPHYIISLSCIAQSVILVNSVLLKQSNQDIQTEHSRKD